MEAFSGKSLRYAVIGAGASIFSAHRPALRLPSIKLVALADLNISSGKQRAVEMGCPFYENYSSMLAEEQPDVAVILTPHPLHAAIALQCLRAGCHVLVEKPMAVQVAEADAMIALANEQQRLLGVVFQYRFRPEVRTMRKLIQEGRLGRIQHVTMTATWTRTASYYRSASWRGTWRGEGGGVLMNQAPHSLDMLCYLLGLPARVFAWTRTSLHAIETEDTAHAALEWSNGALGSLHISTAEADAAEYLKIVGTTGQLELAHGKLHLRTLDNDLAEFITTSPDGFASPPLRELALEVEPGEANHLAVYQAFQQAILSSDYTLFPSPGEEGRMSLELANALIFSSYHHHPVELPLDRARYSELLKTLQQ